MKYFIAIVLLIIGLNTSYGQGRIIYDLDTYRRVDFNFRMTTIMPSADMKYDKILNNPSSDKDYQIRVGGLLNESIIGNSLHHQKVKTRRLNFSLESGRQKFINIKYDVASLNRSYNENRYFINGYEASSTSAYSSQNVSYSFNQELGLSYDLGFGFGRLEVINSAWMGARILEELENNNLLREVPSAPEMRVFFDLIGDLTNERVLDSRLRSIYRIENIIKYIEREGWIEKGSVPAFANIYDSYRFETALINRWSGERLEFKLKTKGKFVYKESNGGSFNIRKYYEPGFEGNVEYSIHRNGDLEYYTIKKLGGLLDHYERFDKIPNLDRKVVSGNIYYEYEYRYLPSFRSNLAFTTRTSAGMTLDDKDNFSSFLRLDLVLVYNYYFSPATQMQLYARLNYNDNRFQVGEYQPRVRAWFSFDLIHAIR